MKGEGRTKRKTDKLQFVCLIAVYRAILRSLSVFIFLPLCFEIAPTVF